MPKSIRVLSLWEPWASAMFTCAPGETTPVKTVETRNWELRGTFPFPLAIHAAKHPYRPADYDFRFTQVVSALRLGGTFAPYGCVLGIVWMTACKQVETIKDIGETERLFGNYVNEDAHGNFEQRYGFISDPSKIKILRSPFRLRGAQGIFTWSMPDDLEFK